MKKSATLLWLFVAAIFSIGVSSAMPPSPELLARIQSGAQAMPYSLSHAQELRAQGYDNPPHTFNYRNSTDELDTVNFRAIVLLVDFSDHPHTTSAGFYDTLLFGGGFRTVKDYYNQVSFGTFHVSTNNNPSVIGWLRMPETYAYYANGQNGEGEYPHNAARMAEDAVAAADSLVDFSLYDNRGTGYIDGLIVVHSGTGAEISGSNNDIWSHTWWTPSFMEVDGVTVGGYCTEPEFWETSRDMTCGVFCHEMGHMMFGLPDLYDTDYSSNGIGRWCLMSGGSWGGTLGNSPSYPSGWCRMKMGFVNPVNVTTRLLNDTINAAETSPTLYRLAANHSDTSSEYFLVENRQHLSYDASLPGSGLLVYHINDTVRSGNRNEWYPGHTSDGHYEVAIEQADGLWSLEQSTNNGDAGDPFPGSTGNRNFVNSSTPNSFGYDSIPTQAGIYDISNSGTAMTASLQVGGSILSLHVPNGPENWIVGSLDTIRWFEQGITGDKVIEINRNYPSGSWDTIATNVVNGSSYVWLVSAPATQDARIRIRTLTMTPGDSGISYNNFTISNPTITLTRPNGGEQFPIGEIHGIFWTSTGVNGNVTIEINRHYPDGNWDTVVTNIPNESPYRWDYPGPATTLARLRIRTLDTTAAAGDSSDSCFTIYSPDNISNSAIPPNRFALYEGYPNPFNSSTTIRFSLRERSDVEMRVYDTGGREVNLILHNRLSAGVHSVKFDGKDLASGLYFVRLVAGREVQIRKIMLVK